ncbi:MAG TPA: nucleoside-triphosphatase [Syntrophomonadaceae bacterium]|nr:nucleoside-triphosphatase [Syntrophomonadaceae bacterium]
MIKNIFLTGPRNVGKSTIIKAALVLFVGTVGGFTTLPKLLNDGRRVFLMDSFNLDYPANYIPYICEVGKNAKLEPILKTFDDFGVRILDDSLQKEVDLVVMDELGVFESEAIYFQEKVKSCLASPIPVLGVIKAKDTKFLKEISDRTDVQVVNVTVNNRKLIKTEIQNIIVKQFNPIANEERR